MTPPNSRLGYFCDWTRLPSAKQRNIERRTSGRKSPSPIRPAVSPSASDEGSSASHDPAQDDIEDIEETALHQYDGIHGTVVTPDVSPLLAQYAAATPVICENMPGFNEPAMPQTEWPCPSPLVDTIIDLTGYRLLPVKVPYTIEDHGALLFYDAEAGFGFGSKCPAWSTHALLKNQAYESPALSHLLLAAASGELWYTCGQSAVLDNAERHYKIAKELLVEIIMDPSADPLKVMACRFRRYELREQDKRHVTLTYTWCRLLVSVPLPTPPTGQVAHCVHRSKHSHDGLPPTVKFMCDAFVAESCIAVLVVEL